MPIVEMIILLVMRKGDIDDWSSISAQAEPSLGLVTADPDGSCTPVLAGYVC